MVNYRMLAQGAKRARAIIDQQGGPDAVRKKVEGLREVAWSDGTVSERAKAAAAIAREKPNPAAPVPAEGVADAGAQRESAQAKRAQVDPAQVDPASPVGDEQPAADR